MLEQTKLLVVSQRALDSFSMGDKKPLNEEVGASLAVDRGQLPPPVVEVISFAPTDRPLIVPEPGGCFPNPDYLGPWVTVLFREI